MMKYDVFISYSRKDYVDENKNVIPNNDVSKIKEALSKAGITFWMDEIGIIPGEDYASKITQHIKACKIFVYISSKAANHSDWTRKEIACALLYKKNLIPLLLDNSPFHDSVILRIADLDRIDYYVNQKLGLEKLVCSIKIILEELATREAHRIEEERKNLEELKLRQELETKRHIEEQKKIISDIKLKCATLNNEETKIELDRATLLLSIEKVTDEEERNLLQKLITNSSPIRKKAFVEIETLHKTNKKYEREILLLEGKIKKLLDECSNKDEEIKRQLEHNLPKTEDEPKCISTIGVLLSNKCPKVGIIVSFLVTIFALSFISLKQCSRPDPIVVGTMNDSIPIVSHASGAKNIPSNEVLWFTDEDTLRAVDLGVSVKWANMNVGAKSSCDVGLYFAWGEVTSKKEYSKDSYIHYTKGQYVLIGEKNRTEKGHIYYNIGGSKYDPATKIQGNKWRMPTETECLELKNACTWVWDTSKFGYVVEGKNGNRIFLPATGCMSGNHIAYLNSKAKKGFYWSSKTAKTKQYSNGESASVLQFDPNSIDEIVVSPIDRVFGRCVRAVCE